MRLTEILAGGPAPSLPGLPDLSRLEQRAREVRDAFPDLAPREPPDIEARIAAIRDWHRRGMPHPVGLAEVLVVAEAVFAPARRARGDLAGLRAFLIEQAELCPQPAFRRAMIHAHLAGWSAPGEPGDRETWALADRLRAAQAAQGLPHPWDGVVTRLPELLFAANAPRRIAALLAEEAAPDRFLRHDCGLPDPQAPGLFDRVHGALLDHLKSRLARRDARAIGTLLEWLHPAGRPARLVGAAQAVSRLIEPFAETPPSDLRNRVRDALRAAYGDPRLNPGAVWPAVSEPARETMRRWLTEESLLFFFDILSKVEMGSMWSRRRGFWERLFREGRIADAWVALSKQAAELARRRAGQAQVDHARQVAGGSRTDTSILLLRVGRTVFVEGSHNYKVHCFPPGHARAPRFYEQAYDCEAIRRDLPDEPRYKKAHVGETGWQRWIEERIREHA